MGGRRRRGSRRSRGARPRRVDGPQVSTAATHAPAASTVAASSMTIDRPIARSASRVERHAESCPGRRRRSSRYTPSGKPTKKPTTGMTKKPTAAASRPAKIDCRGTPASRSRRPGTRTFTSWPPPIRSVAAASAAHPAVEPTARAHTAIAAHTRSAPGSTGTTTPATPTAIARPTRATPRPLTLPSRRLRRLPVLLRGHELQAAVPHDRLAREVRGLVAAHERDERRDLARVARPPRRDAGALLRVRVLVLLAGHRRRDLAGRDRVDRDPVLRELERHHLRQQPEAALRRAVRRAALERDVLVDRRDVDDPPAAAGGDHPPRGGLRAEERAGEVRLEDVTPRAERDLEERRRVAGARVVDEHVEPAERLGEVVDHRRAILRGAEVEPADLGTAARPAHLVGGLVRAGLVGMPGDADVVAVVRERDRGLAADAGVRSGDDGNRHATRATRRARRERAARPRARRGPARRCRAPRGARGIRARTASARCAR